MSVINKVLRDLDQRLASNRTHSLNQSAAPGSPLRLNTRSILAVAKNENPPLWQTLVVGGITLFLVGQAVWWWVKPVPIAPPPPMPIPRLQPLVAAPPPVPVPVAAVSAPIAGASIPASAPASAPISIAASAPSKPVPAVSTPSSAPSSPPATVQSLPKPASTKTATPAAKSASAAASAPALSASQQAAQNEAALALRDTVRQQLVRGDYTGIWNTLSHLEESPSSLKNNNSDLWAIRANAAQRLGRHQECVHAYLVALEANPNEPRWLLGAAVSLAALGKTAQASEMAERARSLAPINKDVLNYLRQSGVSLND